MKGIVLVLLSVLVLSCEPIKDGYVVSKWYEEENYYNTTEVKYVLTLKGKYEPVYVPVTKFDDEDYCIKIENINDKGKSKEKKFEISKREYDKLSIGDFWSSLK